MTDQRNRRRVVSGVVTSDRMNKGISVRVERIFKHPKYKKYIRDHATYHAHDEQNECREGDTVELMECRPLSKLKRWRLVRVLTRTELPGGGVA